MQTITIDSLQQGGHNAPINEPQGLNQSSEPAPHTAFRLQTHLLNETTLDALVLNKASDTLVVALHGATNRANTVLPRFEWLRTLNDYPVSTAYFSDPSLHLSDRLLLSWFTGGAQQNIHSLVAQQSLAIANKLSAKRIIFTGASGGGFAALQISSFIKGSTALAFNAQTDISNYRVNNTSWGATRDYLTIVWPEIHKAVPTNEQLISRQWTRGIEHRISAIYRYSSRTHNTVHIAQNQDEFHYNEHFLPFVNAASAAGNDVHTYINHEGTMHNPPRMSTFKDLLKTVLDEEENRQQPDLSFRP